MRVHVHGGNMELTDALMEHVHSSLDQAIDRFEDRTDRVDVTLENVHGHKHGQELRCHIVASIRRRGVLVVDHVDSDCYAAVDMAMGRLKRAVRRRINRVRDAHRHEAQRSGLMAG